MRLTAILLTIVFMQVRADGLSQTVTFSGKEVPLQKVFIAIEQQTGFVFFYSLNIWKEAKPVTLDVKNVTVDEVLKLVMKKQPFSYIIENKTIIISKKRETVINDTHNVLIPPPINVTGKVINENGEVVIVSITLKGTNRGTTTNQYGEFHLNNVDENTVLIISGVGIETTEINLNGRSQINITVKIALKPLDEVQMIAYGITTKRLNTGSVSTIKAEDIQKQPVSNPLAALQGRIPGMIITQQSGMPGSSFSVQIRGQNSITSGNDPLYIIDGVPYSTQLLPNLGGVPLGISSNNGTGNPLSFINPSDIESIDVLKDADATAIYGSRGANGVVLITTKKGKVGKGKVDINIYHGLGKISRIIDLLDTRQYLDMRYEALKNDILTLTPTTPLAFDLTKWDTTRYTDWQKEMIGGTSHYTNAQVGLSGGNANIQFLIAGRYQKETDIFPGNFADKKGSLHFSISSISSNSKFRALLSGNYISDQNSLGYYDLTNKAFTPPVAPPVYNPDGSLNWANSTWTNPLSLLRSKYNPNTNNLISNASFNYKILSELEFSTSLGYTNLDVKEIRTFPISYFDPAFPATGYADFTNNTIRTWIIEPQLNYQKIIGKGKLTFLIGTTFQENRLKGDILNASGFTNDAFLENIQAASTVKVQSVTNTQYKYHAIFGRLNYRWEEKYLINLTGRRDGSSRFGPDKQFSNFGAVGAGWIFSNENIFKRRLQFLSFGKLKFSYGTTGNDQIGDYQFISTYSSTSSPYQGTQGLYPNNLLNADYSWEINKKLELGCELGFLKDRIFFSANYYRNRSSNQLVGSSLPGITGFTSITANLPALVENTGVELLLNTTNLKNKNFNWSSSINFSIPRNELVDFPNLSSSSYRDFYIIGQPLNFQKVYHLIGVDPQTGVYQFADNKGDPTFTPDVTADRNVIINTAPKFYGGFQNTFQFKGVELDIFFQFMKQTGRNYLFNNPFPPGMYFLFNQPTEVLERWQNPGDNALYQKFTTTASSSAYKAYQFARSSDYAYSDASFIRLKNLSLSYRLPKILTQKYYLQNCRIYINCQNLLTITRFKGMDPENQSTSNLPPLRVIAMGIQITF